MLGPLVSIIVPLYNAESTLRRALDSLARQTYPNIEVLLVDDGSTDGSRMICEEHAALDPRFKVLSSPHRGVAAARNVALGQWRGDLLMFADADDVVDDRYVGRLLEVLEWGDSPVATCIAHDCHGEPPEDWRCDDEPGEPRRITLGDYDFTRRWSHRVLWGAIYRREVVEGLRFDERFASSTDTLFAVQVLMRAGSVSHVDEELYCYVMQPESVSKGHYDRRKFDDILVWEEIVRLLSDGPALPRETAALMTFTHAYAALKKMAVQRDPDKGLVDDLCDRMRGRFDAVGFAHNSATTRFVYFVGAVAPHLRYAMWRLVARLSGGVR